MKQADDCAVRCSGCDTSQVVQRHAEGNVDAIAADKALKSQQSALQAQHKRCEQGKRQLRALLGRQARPALCRALTACIVVARSMLHI